MSGTARKLAKLAQRIQMPLCLTVEEAAKELRLRPARMRWLVATFRIRTVLFRGKRYVMPAEMERVRKSLGR